MPPGTSPDLRGRIAVVAGATRGAGRGIAAALGEAGATVVCTGRSSTSGALRSDYDRSETVEETAQLVTDLGGTGIAVAVDHLDPNQVRGLAERLRSDYGATAIRSRRPASRIRRLHDSSDAESRRWQPTPPAPGGTSAR